MPYYHHQDSYSTISDHRTLSEDSEDQYNYQAQSQQYPSYYEDQNIIQQQFIHHSMNYEPQEYQPHTTTTPKSKQASNKKRNRTTKLPQDEEKRKNFLERNRLAALKCRQRKKQWLLNLQTRVEFLTNDNDHLQMESEALRKEVMELKTLLLAHKDCPNYMRVLKTSSNFVNPTQSVLYHHSMHLNNNSSTTTHLI